MRIFYLAVAVVVSVGFIAEALAGAPRDMPALSRRVTNVRGDCSPVKRLGVEEASLYVDYQETSFDYTDSAHFLNEVFTPGSYNPGSGKLTTKSGSQEFIFTGSNGLSAVQACKAAAADLAKSLAQGSADNCSSKLAAIEQQIAGRNTVSSGVLVKQIQAIVSAQASLPPGGTTAGVAK